jgi:hypothetical protein
MAVPKSYSDEFVGTRPKSYSDEFAAHDDAKAWRYATRRESKLALNRGIELGPRSNGAHRVPEAKASIA